MALMKLGIVATDIRNSVGGTVFSRNNGGAYTRARVAPINRRTPKQTFVRNNFAINSKAWSATLTATQRSAWTFFAQHNPSVNVLGASIILSGLAMYNRLNQVLSQIGDPNISDPPADLSVQPLAPITGVTATSGGPTMELVTTAQALVPQAEYLIFATGPLSAGRKPPTSAYRFMGSFPSVAAAVAVNFLTEWNAAFGALNTGNSIGVSAGTVNNLSGATTPPLIFNIIST